MRHRSVAQAVAVASLCTFALPLVGCDSGSSADLDAPGAPPGSPSPSPSNPSTPSSPNSPVDYTPPPSTVLPSLFGTPSQSGAGSTSDRWSKADVKRNDVSYYFMANGWGPGFKSQTVTWQGTSFSVDAMEGMRGAGYEPASYPTMFCGVYSDSHSGNCGLPKALSDIRSLRTGWRWNAGGNTGQYNAAYDVWLSTDGTIQGHSAFLMVWLRDPPGQQPAGSRHDADVLVNNAPGSWDIWVGKVSGKPCISYVRREGHDSPELEIDAMDFVRDAQTRKFDMPGTTLLSVAVGFEIWNGPITGLKSEDFYVQVE